MARIENEIMQTPEAWANRRLARANRHPITATYEACRPMLLKMHEAVQRHQSPPYPRVPESVAEYYGQTAPVYGAREVCIFGKTIPVETWRDFCLENRDRQMSEKLFCAWLLKKKIMHNSDFTNQAAKGAETMQAITKMPLGKTVYINDKGAIKPTQILGVHIDLETNPAQPVVKYEVSGPPVKMVAASDIFNTRTEAAAAMDKAAAEADKAGHYTLETVPLNVWLPWDAEALASINGIKGDTHSPILADGTRVKETFHGDVRIAGNIKGNDLAWDWESDNITQFRLTSRR